jgi:predicted ribosomally synthesized peptide with SipW-like signal peptide
MTNSKSTKGALLVSSVSLLLCFAMLLGTTFAWFTDSATSKGNRIKAGNLDVKLLMWNGTQYVDISDKTGDIFAEAENANSSNKTLWEPGKTQVVYLAIENAGTLDLKYNVNIKAYKDAANTVNDIDMTPAMRYAITPDAKNGTGVTAWASANAKAVELGMNKTQSEDVKLGKDQKHYFALSVHMLEDAGNEYQDASVLFDLIVNATQLSSEEDSFNSEYDKDATYAVTNADALENIITDDEVTNAKIDLANGNYDTNFKVDGGKNLTIEGNGKDTVLSGQIATTSSTAGTITLKNMTIKVDDSIADSTGISQTGKSAIAIWGNQTVICENVTFDMSLADSTAITSWWDTGVGTTIIVRNCTFNCNGQRPIRATGNVTVENCTFNDPYRYAVQLTAKSSTATEMNKASINFKNNTIVNGVSGKAFVYGIQLEGSDYGCHDCVINGAGNTIVDGGADSTMYYCECGKVDHATIEWDVETTPVHKE